MDYCRSIPAVVFVGVVVVVVVIVVVVVEVEFGTVGIETSVSCGNSYCYCARILRFLCGTGGGEQ